ncbi:SIMPL domain-containing protein [Agrococcus lahaulensis]|uniref:SIMPL domain-containing protein n=1 Tax=Agrococcus lahaulensis TaxID=341722 RepID=UPI00047D6276|nr:SIMPL domain-containing protein [Agrococcus lahaulensis]
MVEILVRGEAALRAPAERATVTVHSRWQADAPDAAMSAVAAAHAGAAERARELAAAGAIESWHADRAWVSHHREWVGEGLPQRLVFTASAAVTATFVDVDALGAWIGELGSAPEHEVGGVTWSLAEETERRLASQSRALAVEDARARAADYARAAGLGDPAITSIREPDPAAPRPLGRARAGVEAAMLASADGGSPVALTAGEIEVEAVVEVAFRA